MVNVDQEELRGEGACLKAMMEWAEREGSKVVIICGDLEAELSELKEEEEREEFRKELGLEGSSLERLIQVGYEILELVTFYTTVSLELRAWTVSKGTPAPKAAGKIHSDIERGFIRAEIISYSRFYCVWFRAFGERKGTAPIRRKRLSDPGRGYRPLPFQCII